MNRIANSLILTALTLATFALPDVTLGADKRPTTRPDAREAESSSSLDPAAAMVSKGGQRDEGTTESPKAGKSAEEMSVFYLKYAEAQSVSATLSQLFRELSMVVDQRLNAIIVRSDSQEDLAKLEAVLKVLDQPIQPDQAEQPDRSRKPTPEDLMRALRGGARANARQQPAQQQPAQQQPAVLRENYNRLEQHAAQLSAQYRDLPDGATRGTVATALNLQLADTVKQAFAARQQLQLAELAQLRRRLAGIEQQITTRNNIKDAIIERRVAELLNPDLRWEGDRESTFPSAASAKTQPPRPTTEGSGPLYRMNRMSALQEVFGQSDAAKKQVGPLLLFFHADWCQPSRKLRPRIEKLREEGLSIVDVDMTTRTDVQRAFQVDRIPTLILHIDGVEVGRVDGPGIEPLIERYRAEVSKAKSQAETSAAGGAAVTQSQSLHALTQTGDYASAKSKPDAQIVFRGLEGARVTCYSAGTAESAIRLPGRIAASSGQTLPFRLSDIPAHAGLELSGTIELAPIGPQTKAYLQHNVIPTEIHNEDVVQASAGNLVTKVIYLPKPEHQELALAGVESIVSTRLDPGLDPIAEADRSGHILAILRLGNRVQIPATDSSDAIVWIEAIIEEPDADGGRESKAVYMFGTIVSPDGLVATVLEQGQTREQIFERFRTAAVGPNRKGRLVSYQPEYGIALLKVDATGLPFLALASDPIAANLRLKVQALGGYGPDYASHTWQAHVFQTNHCIGETEGFFTIVTYEPPYGLHAGAALVSANGQLQGIVGRNSQLPLEEASSDPTPKLWAVPANVIAGLIEKYRADSSEADAQSVPNVSSAGQHRSTGDWAGSMFAETRCDLGVVALGTKVQHCFVVENPYVEDARIASVRSTSKHILVPQITKQSLKTHEKSEIVVEVEAQQTPGAYTETLTVIFDKPFDAQVALPLNWTVREQPQLEPVEEGAETDGAGAKDPAKLIWDLLGVKLRLVSRDDLPNDRFRGGMQVIEIRKDSPAAEAKLRVDDIIVGIHRWETTSMENVAFVLNHPDLQPKQSHSPDVKFFVLRGGETLFTMLRLAEREATAN